MSQSASERSVANEGLVKPVVKRNTLFLRIKIPQANRSIFATIQAINQSSHQEFRTYLEKQYWKRDGDFRFYRVDSEGWSTEIIDQESSLCSINIDDLRDNDIVELRSLTGNVGPKTLPEVIAATEKHNRSLQEKINTLSRDYCGVRIIRGDGNCYYRSIIFGILEQVVAMGVLERKQILELVRDRLAKVRYDRNSWEYDSHNNLITILNEAIDGYELTNLDNLEYKILETGQDKLDEMLIRACRKLTAQYLMENQAKDLLPGFPLRDAILPSYGDCHDDMSVFCRKYVTEMGIDAEGAFIELGILPSLLGCQCTIIYLDRIIGYDLKAFTNTAIDKIEFLRGIHVHILLRPGHYDMLYAKSESESADVPADAPAPASASDES